MKNMKKKGYAMGGKMKKKGYAAGGALKTPTADQKGIKKLPKPVRNKMGYMAKGGMTSKKKGYAMGGMTGAYDPVKADMQRQQGMMQGQQQQQKPKMAKGGAMKKKGYAKGGKVMTYNLGGMVKSQTDNRKNNKK
jgi:hypothetical protein